MEKIFKSSDKTSVIADEVVKNGSAAVDCNTTPAREKCNEVVAELKRRGVAALTLDKVNDESGWMSFVYRTDVYEELSALQKQRW